LKQDGSMGQQGNNREQRSPRQPLWRRWFGTRSERAAQRFLRKLGYRIVRWNYRNEIGEIDIVAVDGQCVVFIEVRSTEGGDALRPAESVDLAKQRRLTQVALRFLKEHRLLNETSRFDVLAISWPAGAREPSIVHYKNAFEAVGRFQLFN
jgi:putative endonuclease